METLRIGTYSKLMGCFEDNDEFKPEAQRIVEMYETVCRETLRKARFGISDDELRIEAAIWQAAAETLEVLLLMYLTKAEHKKADFSNLKEFARDVSKTLSKEK